MYSKIIVPIAMDRLDRGEKSLLRAKSLLDDGGEIVILNVVEDVALYMQGYMVSDFPLNYMETSRRAALDTLTELREKVGIEARVEVRNGRAASAIEDVAEDEKADLVIVASHMPVLSDYFLGTTAERVARHCKCSVLVER